MAAGSETIPTTESGDGAKTEDGLCRRRYRIGGVTVQVESPIPFSDDTFEPKFIAFRVDGPGGEGTITGDLAAAEHGPDALDEPLILRHHFALPDATLRRSGHRREVYREPPWAVFRGDDAWIYEGILPDPDARLWCVVVADDDHARIDLYHPDETAFRRGNWHSLSMLPTDQIVLARALATRQACYLHASGVILNRRGLAFVGHSDAGKTTISRQLMAAGAELLCDDRVVVRDWPDGFRLHGTWSHGDIPEVSGSAAPLGALLFLEQADHNRLVVLEERDAFHRLASCVVRPLVSADWWEPTLDLLARLAAAVPCYELLFDTSGAAAGLVGALATGDAPSATASHEAETDDRDPERKDAWSPN